MSESALPGDGGFALPGLPGRSEERLARRAAAGDERAFAAIFRRYGPELHRYCLAIVGNQADAQDALQNVMVKALRSLPGERREIKLKPWLYRVAHNESVDLLRRRQPSEELDPDAAAPGTGLAETAEQRGRLRHLLADLGQLPERQRGALLMRELSGLDFEQIGAAIGSSAATARQTVYEARLGLREMEAGREMSCDLVAKAISDGDGRVLRRRDVRAHLRACPECRAFQAGIEGRRHDLAAIGPLPAVAVAALLKGAFGSAAGAVGAGGAAVGGTAAGSAAAGAAGGIGAVGSAGLVKAAATVAVVAAVGVGAADRAGLVHIGDAGTGQPARESTAAGTPPPRAAGGQGDSPADVAGSGRALGAGRGGTASARVTPAVATPGSASGAAGSGPAHARGAAQGGAARHASVNGRAHGRGLQGGGPPSHSQAGGNSANAHANGGRGHRAAAEHKAASHGPAGSPPAAPKGGNQTAGANGKGTSHASPPAPSPHKAEAKAAPPAATEAPAGEPGAEAEPAPEARGGKGPPAEAEPEGSS